MTTLVRDLMKRDVLWVPPSATLVELERLFIDQRIHGLPVVDEGKLVGVVSQFDLVRRLLANHEFAEYAEAEQRERAANFTVPLRELGPSSTRELQRNMESKLRSLRARDVMTTPAVTISQDASVESAGRLLQEKRIQRLIVVEAGRVVGLLAALDIVGYYCGPVT